MPQPTLADVHVDSPLTDYSFAQFQNSDKHIWNRVFGTQGSQKQSNKYFTYTKAELLRTDAQKRAPGTESAGRNYKLSTDSFFCDVWALHIDVSEQVIANQDDPLDAEEDAARLLASDIGIRLDVEFASAFFGTSIWGTDKTGGTDFTKWSDAAATPIENLSAGIVTVKKNTGYIPNTLLLGFETWYGDGTNQGLMHHPDIIARLPDNAPRIATPEFLGNLIGIPRVFIAESVRNTAQEGLAATYAFNLADNALLCYADANPGPRSPNAANVFVWSGLVGSTQGIRTKRMDMPWQDAFPRVETDAAVDFKVVGSDLGYFFTDCV